LRDPKEATMPDSTITDSLTTLLADAMPLAIQPYELGERRVGLVIVDEVNGFATVGAGNLAPPVENPQVTTMVSETDRLAREFSSRGLSILAFLDTHAPGKPEPPYPPHCEAGTGEEDLVPELAWLEDDANATLVRKDCINGFIGAIQADGSNRVVDWVNANRLQALLVVGICTDICVMDFVLTILSARNHDMMPGLEDIVVHAPGCATYDLPRAATGDLGLPETLSHPGSATHYMGLYFMASRGALLTDAIGFNAPISG
jgi:nicotinamidase-related amidase